MGNQLMGCVGAPLSPKTNLLVGEVSVVALGNMSTLLTNMLGCVGAVRADCVVHEEGIIVGGGMVKEIYEKRSGAKWAFCARTRE